MPTSEEIQAALNAMTTALNVLGDVDWNLYATDGPGMHAPVLVATQLCAHSGMCDALIASIIEPVGVMAAALDQAVKAG